MFKMKQVVMNEAPVPAGAPDPQSVAASVNAPVSSSEEVSEPEETDSNVWNEMMEDDDDSDERLEPEAKVADEEEVEPAAAVETPVVPEVKEEVVAEAEVTPQTPEAPEVKEEPEPAQKVEAKAQTEEERQALREKIQKNLQSVYQLTEEDAELMLSEPDKVLPKMAANLHMEIYSQVMQTVFSQVPQMVNQVLESRQVNEAAVKGFYETWPDLKKHEREVQQFAPIWRQMNPTAPVEEAIKQIGRHMMIALGYPLQGAVSQSTAAPVVRPHAPAPMTAVQPAPVPRPRGQFEQLAEEFLVDEDF